MEPDETYQSAHCHYPYALKGKITFVIRPLQLCCSNGFEPLDKNLIGTLFKLYNAEIHLDREFVFPVFFVFLHFYADVFYIFDKLFPLIHKSITTVKL